MSDEATLYAYINKTPRLLSLLFDTNLLPEQTMGTENHHITMLIAQAWAENDKQWREKQ